MNCPNCNHTISNAEIASALGKKGGLAKGSGRTVDPETDTPEKKANRERVRKHRAKKNAKAWEEANRKLTTATDMKEYENAMRTLAKLEETSKTFDKKD